MAVGLQSCILSSMLTSLHCVVTGECAGLVATEAFFDLFEGGALSVPDSASESSTEES